MSRPRHFTAAASALILLTCFAAAKQPSWVEVRSPNFIVVSNAGEKQARKAAVQFEQIRTVFAQTITIARNHPSPVITVLAVKDEDSMRELLPEYWANGHSHPAGYFASQLNLFFAAVQLDVPGLNPYETFYHEYYHTISVPYVPYLPIWLAEGLAEFFGHTDIEEKNFSMGDADPLLLQELRSTPLIPLNTLFAVDRDSPYYNESNKTSIFYAECWALTHYLMIGDRMAHKPMLTTYLDQLDKGKSPTEAATLAFGDIKKLESALETYIHNSSYYHLKLPSPQFNDDQMEVRVLSEAEADAYRGGFAAVCGRSQDAFGTLNQALRLDPNLALAHEYLALAQFTARQRDQALDSASKAISLDPNNSFTRYLRAFLETSGAGMRFSDQQTEDDLRQAIAISPNFAPPYGLLAVYLATLDRNLDEAMAFAQKAISFEPANSNYQLALAQVLIRQNKFDAADLATKRALAWARQPAEKVNAENFQQFLLKFRQMQSEMAANGAESPVILAPLASSEKPADAATPPSPKLRFEDSGPSINPPANSFASTFLKVQTHITLIGSPMGVDFNSYFKELMEAIRKNVMSSVVQVRLAEPTEATLEVNIAKDGRISGMNIASSSGNDVLDKSTLAGIIASAPLPPLPAEFKGESLKVRLRFSYAEETN
jgi:TonB family protein